jgi:hypothetical protein
MYEEARDAARALVDTFRAINRDRKHVEMLFAHARFRGTWGILASHKRERLDVQSVPLAKGSEIEERLCC